jgi:hypothetical protein
MNFLTFSSLLSLSLFDSEPPPPPCTLMLTIHNILSSFTATVTFCTHITRQVQL